MEIKNICAVAGRIDRKDDKTWYKNRNNENIFQFLFIQSGGNEYKKPR